MIPKALIFMGVYSACIFFLIVKLMFDALPLPLNVAKILPHEHITEPVSILNEKPPMATNMDIVPGWHG